MSTPTNYPLRAPCSCGSTLGKLTRRSSLVRVFCRCGVYAYSVSYSELHNRGIIPEEIPEASDETTKPEPDPRQLKLL